MKKAMDNWVVKTVIFLFIGLVLYRFTELIFMNKDNFGTYISWKNTSEDVDILILGNSHAAAGFRAQDMEEELGRAWGKEISIYNYSPSGARIEQIQFLLKELLKRHVPKMVILETYAFCPIQDGHRDMLARWAFDIIPLNLNKIEAIRYCVNENRVSHYFPMVQYHFRWIDLTKEDFDLLKWVDYRADSGGNGSGFEGAMEDPNDNWFENAIPAENDIQPLTPDEKESFENLLSILREKDISLLLVSVPYKEQLEQDGITQIRINNGLREGYVNDEDIRLLDMNRMWEEMDIGYGDFENEGHVNVAGSEKVTAVLLEYLKENYTAAELFDEG